MTDDLMSTSEILTYIGVSQSTLTRMDRRGEGPPAIRVGARRKMYRREDLARWLEARRL